jgi:hypothetical protein
MKTKLIALLAITLVLLWLPLQSQSQSSTQPIKYFGYFYTVNDSDLSRVRSYTNFTYIDGQYGQSSIDTLVRLRSYGHRAIIDLGKVLWCPDDPNNPFGAWHLCRDTEVNYTQRWNDWKWANRDVLTGDYVLAFSVITEPVLRSISTADVETAVGLVKQTFPSIPTLVAEAYISVNESYVVPSNPDWVGIAGYYIHPNLDPAFKHSVDLLKGKKQWWQKTAYTLDAFYGSSQISVAPTVADMDTIAQEWYTFASQDPEAMVLAAFTWPDLTGENAIGSISFPQNVLDKHAAIGSAILSGRVPTYQGWFDSVNCQSLVGWAWDASEPNTPISVDIYDGVQKIGTVRANQYRSDLYYAGIGNGWHGFSFNLPQSIRNGQTHSIAIKYSGLDQQLNASPQSITCAAPAAYEGYVDTADCNSIVGWAADRNRLNTSITVSIYDGATFVTSVWANNWRSDVGSYLGDNGYHGFAIPTPSQFKDGFQHTLRVKYESTTTELYSSPRTITCTAQPTYYEIVARHSGKCLDVEGGSTAAGALVKQYTCGGWTNQQWQVVSVGGGYYKIVARHSGKVLDVQWAGLDNGVPVWQWDENGTAAQQWAITDVGGGYVWIMARHSGKALDVEGGYTTDGAQVHQWDYVGIPNQQWLLRPVQ